MVNLIQINQWKYPDGKVNNEVSVTILLNEVSLASLFLNRHVNDYIVTLRLNLTAYNIMLVS